MINANNILDALPSQVKWNLQNWDYLRGVLDSGYGQTWRKYHNFNHILDLILKANRIRSINHRLELYIAILFHDIVYNCRAQPGENEAQSVDVAKQVGPRCFFDVEWDRVHEIIMTTVHDGRAASCEGQMLADLDMSGFADSYSRFERNGRAIVEEYQSVFPLDQVLQGRLKFLRATAQRIKDDGRNLFYSLYNVEDFYAPQVEQNIRQACADLEAQLINLQREQNARQFDQIFGAVPVDARTDGL